jgi:DNA-binding NtrC family response regulator
MTAYAERDLLEEARQQGAAEILTKPVLPKDLLPLLDSALEQRRPVLLVDDDAEFLSTLAAVVERAGHSVLQAGGLAEALERLDEIRPGVVVLDLRLQPDLEPVDCVLAIRRASPGIVFVLHSGYPELMSDTRARIPGEWVQGCLRKPFPPGELLDLLDELAPS